MSEEIAKDGCVGDDLVSKFTEIGYGSYSYIVSYSTNEGDIGNTWWKGQMFAIGSRGSNGMLGLWIIPQTNKFNEFWDYKDDFRDPSHSHSGNGCVLPGGCDIPERGQIVVRYDSLNGLIGSL